MKVNKLTIACFLYLFELITIFASVFYKFESYTLWVPAILFFAACVFHLWGLIDKAKTNEPEED